MNGNRKSRFSEILTTSTKLGLTSFGGPVAHLAYFKDEYVDRRKWLDDKTYAEIIALCQFLPGPASSQVGISIGILRGGLIGGLLSWIGFTLPSVLVLIVFALMYQALNLEGAQFIQSLKVVAVAVVLHALIGMGQKLTPDRPRIAMAIIAGAVMLLYPSAWVQIIVIIVGGVAGYLIFRQRAESNIAVFKISISKKMGIAALGILGGLLVLLPMLNRTIDHALLNIFDIFFRVGALVFGGGHVVLPMIEREVVPTGLMEANEFLAGYGMAQAVPGPLFTFASYLGTIMAGVPGGIVATIAIFLPSFLLIIGALPFLNMLRKYDAFQGVLVGVNAVVVGILLAAFYDPVFTSSIFEPVDFVLALILFFLLSVWKLPAWMVVLVGIVAGYILHLPLFV
ncbi:chromate efflux transporter [Salinicoccus sesuvii]|uniref:Chromate efflux transporter n=1 Tax=Salinicoccus sesuvii TaxID=868281 RepID=A0ABV7N2I5_9STAP